MRWVWTGLLAIVVGYWGWSLCDHHVTFRYEVGRGATIFFKSGGLAWIVGTLIGGLATGWQVYGLIADRGRLSLWSVGAMAIWSTGVVLFELVADWRRLADYGWGFTGWAGLDLAAKVVFFFAALKSCELALGDRRAARA